MCVCVRARVYVCAYAFSLLNVSQMLDALQAVCPACGMVKKCVGLKGKCTKCSKNVYVNQERGRLYLLDGGGYYHIQCPEI